MAARTPDDWFRAARDILKERGGEHVTLREMGKALEVSTGSFYHHFSSRNDFVDQLFADWADEARTAVEDMVARGHRTLADLNRDINERIDHRLEAAMRAWALFDRRVAAKMADFDETRRRFFRNYYRDRIRGQRATDIVNLHLCALIGAQFLFHEDPEALNRFGSFVNRTAERVLREP